MSKLYSKNKPALYLTASFLVFFAVTRASASTKDSLKISMEGSDNGFLELSSTTTSVNVDLYVDSKIRRAVITFNRSEYEDGRVKVKEVQIYQGNTKMCSFVPTDQDRWLSKIGKAKVTDEREDLYFEDQFPGNGFRDFQINLLNPDTCAVVYARTPTDLDSTFYTLYDTSSNWNDVFFAVERKFIESLRRKTGFKVKEDVLVALDPKDAADIWLIENGIMSDEGNFTVKTHWFPANDGHENTKKNLKRIEEGGRSYLLFPETVEIFDREANRFSVVFAFPVDRKSAGLKSLVKENDDLVIEGVPGRTVRVNLRTNLISVKKNYSLH